jgi:hypothetical protein
LTVRWVRDVFLETYDPTIEGKSPIHQYLLVTPVHIIPCVEEYRRVIEVDGVLSSVRLN